MKNPFRSHKTWTVKRSICEVMGRQRDTRINSGTSTEFIFCNRTFGAVILDASESGMKLSCEVRLGIGSIIQLVDPAISAKIVWRDDENNLMGIEFVKNSTRSCMNP